MDIETKCENETATPSPNAELLEAIRETEELFDDLDT